MLSIVAALSLGIIVSFSMFLMDFKQGADEVRYADAIVVLTGGIGRMEEGLRLFKEGKGGYLVISGVEGGSRLAEIFPRRDLRSMVDVSKIILDINSKNTIENAVNVRQIVEDKDFKSMILVTSNYHMTRAFVIFRKAVNGEVKIYRHPVNGPNFTEEWWKDLNSLKIVLNEFSKYCWFRVWKGGLRL